MTDEITAGVVVLTFGISLYSALGITSISTDVHEILLTIRKIDKTMHADKQDTKQQT